MKTPIEIWGRGGRQLILNQRKENNNYLRNLNNIMQDVKTSPTVYLANFEKAQTLLTKQTQQAFFLSILMSQWLLILYI